MATQRVAGRVWTKDGDAIACLLARMEYVDVDSCVHTRGMGLLALYACLALAGCADRAQSPAGQQPGGVTESQSGAGSSGLSGSTFSGAIASGRAELVFAYVPASGFAGPDEAGRPTGVTVELLRDFAAWVVQAHGIDVHVSWHAEPSWSTFYGQVRDSRGGVLGVGNVTITEARQSELDFSPPYMSNVAALVTHASVPELPAMAQIGDHFGSLTGLVFPGTLHQSRLEAIRDAHFAGMATRPVESNEELVALLAADEGYFGYLDIYNFWRAEQAGQPLRRHAVGDDASETFGVILPDGSDWTPVIAAFFQADGGYVQGPRFRAHMEQHLGTELAGLLLDH